MRVVPSTTRTGLADIEVMPNQTRSAPTLCVTDGQEVIPNTPDGRPQMNKANAIQLGDGCGSSRLVMVVG